MISGVGLVALIINRIRADRGVGVASVSFLAAFVMYLVAWLVVLMILPRTTNDPGALLPGAAIVALTMTGMQAISQLYIPDRMSRASELYGTFGATIVTLGWFFILGRTIVVAIVCNAVIHERFGRITNFVFSWPLIRLLRKSSLVRRVFDLEDWDTAEARADVNGELRAALERLLAELKPDRRTVKDDVVAGLPGAISSVPDGMAASVLAGVNPVYGLYASGFGPIAGGLTSNTRLMVITTTSAAALAAGSTLSGVNPRRRPGGRAVPPDDPRRRGDGRRRGVLARPLHALRVALGDDRVPHRHRRQHHPRPDPRPARRSRPRARPTRPRRSTH